MKKEVCFVSWIMSPRCNFNCKYCGCSDTKPNKKYLEIDKIIRALKKTGKQWIIGMVGGEPFIYPNFIKICKQLTKHFKIEFGTNLSISSKLKEFVDVIPPNKVYSVDISTHIEERERIKGVERFIENILLLKEKKFNIHVNYVLHPTLIEKFKKDYKYFKSRGIKLLPKPFKGKYNGKSYPSSYSKDEKNIISKYNPIAFLQTPFNSRGFKCNAGKTFIRINMEGVITRCIVDNTVLGDITKGITLNKEAEPCKQEVCECFGSTLIKDFKKIRKNFK